MMESEKIQHICGGECGYRELLRQHPRDKQVDKMMDRRCGKA